LPAGVQEKFAAGPVVVYAAARRNGRRLAHGWAEGESALSAITQVLDSVKAALPDRRSVRVVDSMELVFAHDFREVSMRNKGWSSNIYRGIRGLEFSHEKGVERFSPTYMLSTNRDFLREVGIVRSQYRVKNKASLQDIRYRRFEADQWLVMLAGQDRQASYAVRMERGNQFVEPQSVDASSTRTLARLATDWMSSNLHEDGRMTYKYWPSARRESTANNMIRQWMATIAMIRAARFWQDEALMARAADNIDYNLSQFYRQEENYGLIEWQGKVKLGAVALAALALAEHPQRQRWQAYEQAMQRTIEYLWQPNGAFQTFYKPAGRNDVQNFYPGEALLYWATLFEESRDKAMQERIMASFRYYRDWHLKPSNRNPAFIPWHTQAYYKVWKITENADLQAFIYQMNDWLLDEMQLPDSESEYRDTRGRFYNPDRPYGPPHASSTGVYLEGLIDAFELARATGDEKRSERYRQAIRRGLRSVMQLQFVDEVDMFYVPDALRQRVRGGIRTTVYNNEIRCDNVQHNLMGTLKILQGFDEADYLE